MTNYNYKKAVKDDIKKYIDENINLADYADTDELQEYLQDMLWAENSVTRLALTLVTLMRLRKTSRTIGIYYKKPLKSSAALILTYWRRAQSGQT